MSILDLSLVPLPDVVEPLDYEAILSARKARLLDLTPESDRPALAATLELGSEPLVILLQENAYRELILRQRINEAARSVMLAQASGADLDNLAANEGVARLVLQAGDASAVPPVPRMVESDDRLRYRVQLAREARTTAGTRGMYEFHALSASARVAAAYPEGPAMDFSGGGPATSNGVPPGLVKLWLLSTDHGGVADAPLLADVSAYVNDETRRVFTDTVQVLAAEIVEYSITAALWLEPGPSEAPILAQAQANAAAFAAAHFGLDKDVRLSGLYAALHVAGVQRVALAGPSADLVIAPGQAAQCTAITITIGGRDV
jgi:phage-related baseplate assembly protein